MKKHYFLILATSLFLFYSCKDGTNGQGDHIFPKNEYQTVEQLQDGEKTNSCYRARHRLNQDPDETINDVRCVTDGQNTAVQKKIRYVKRKKGTLRRFTGWMGSFLKKSREEREAAGGDQCICEPMGEMCAPKSCHCSEICPANSSILKAKQDRIRPTVENSLAFNNSSRHNDGAYETYPLSGGYCSGHTRQRQKFSYLADFQSDLQTIPQMKIGDETFKEYTKHEIDKLEKGKKIVFQGFSGFEDMKEKAPDLHDYLLKKLKIDSIEDIKTDSDGNREYTPKGGSKALPLNSISFENVDEEEIKGITALDPYTGKDIPPQHKREAYREYVAEQVTMVSRYSQPAVIPGYENLRELSDDPQYQEIMGANTAIDWRHYNELDRDLNRGKMITEEGDYNSPMTKADLQKFMETIEKRLPLFDPSASKKGWNKEGPWETLPMTFRATNKDPKDGDAHLYHAVEAWGYQEMPDGKKRLCIADPNSSTNNDNCRVYFEIDENATPSVTYSSWPNRNIGKMMVAPSAVGQNGRYMHQLVHACRLKNKDNFYVGCDERDDPHCGDEDYKEVDIEKVEQNVEESIKEQKKKLQDEN